MDAAALYPQHEKTIRKAVNAFRSRFWWKRFDEEELLGIAYLGYDKAMRTYNPTRQANLDTWIGSRVFWELKDSVRQQRHDPLADERHIGPRFSFDKIMEELTDDAVFVVKLLCEGDLPTRAPLVSLLRSMGWAGQRIAEVFREVRELL